MMLAGYPVVIKKIDNLELSQLESMMIDEQDPVREYHKQHECVHFLFNPESMNKVFQKKIRGKLRHFF